MLVPEEIPEAETPEMAQALVAAFAHDRLTDDPAGRRHLLRNIGAISATGVGVGITRTVSETEPDSHGSWVRAGDTVPVATAAEYADCVRSVGGPRYEPIRARAEMLGAYTQFAPLIA